MPEVLKIRNARSHNLKGIDLDLPLNKLICFAGPSGSGKTSLAFHTLYHESKRRFLNSFPSGFKFFSEKLAPAEVDEIFPVLPVFGLPQINPVMGTRSTIADTMQLTPLLQNLYYQGAKEYCPDHNLELTGIDTETQFRNQLESDKVEGEKIIHFFVTKEGFLTHFEKAPFPSRSYFQGIRDFEPQDLYWEVSRVKVEKTETLNSKLAPYLEKGLSVFFASSERDLTRFKITHEKQCPKGDYESVGRAHLSHFSAFNALGACENCQGFGATLEYDIEKLVDKNKSVSEGAIKLLSYKNFSAHLSTLKVAMKANKLSTQKPLKDQPKKFWDILYDGQGRYPGFNQFFAYLERKKYKPAVRIFVRARQKEVLCEACHGSRVTEQVHNYKLTSGSKSYFDLFSLTLDELYEEFQNIDTRKFQLQERKLHQKVLRLLKTAQGIGIGHLSLLRKSKSVSAGEYQRLLLIKHLSYEGSGSLFVFDEPSLGLGQKEQRLLISEFRSLIAQGNSVIVIDHSETLQKESDFVVEMGPKAGILGGSVQYFGPYKAKRGYKSLIKPLVLSSKKSIKVKAPKVYDYQFQDFEVPLNSFTLVTGSSGSGKTASLINVLANKLHYDRYDEYLNIERGVGKITGSPDFDEVFVIDSNLNRFSSRSTLGSLTDLFTVVRRHFINLPEAKSMGIAAGHLSPNSKDGQCARCEGRGHEVIEMQFLEDIKVTCEDCNGRKLKPIYAELSDGEMSVYEAYSKPLHEIMDRIELTPKYKRIYEYLKLLKLDYLSLDRTINSLSGGERQRVYLLSKLQKDLAHSILFFENLSFGLSKVEIEALAEFLQKLTLKGNTVVLIDQDPLFSKACNHLIEFI